MIIARLFGRAGNQLFQYAAGRALADHLGVELALDDRYVTLLHDWGNCFEHFANARTVPPPTLPPAKFQAPVRYALWRAAGRRPRFRRERELGFDPAFFDIPDGSYLHGYWQSEKYFAPIAEQLRRDLQFTTPLDPANAAMAERIARTEQPVAVHVRRGDYIASGGHGTCSPAYYRAAVEAIAARVNGPLTCFVFSNDPGWARANLELGAETVVVDINDESRGHFDLHLMSLCAHNVIANSSFSWWGAWLNPSETKHVVAPRAWFGDAALSNPDICPDAWLRL
ncbi:alpha-1,2-fucosyltransferase [Roseovarius salinarum]|uniref:alpha-1,2-fucosyltransferase n=1 Tax=Roseovarius salinarum TaxID=1981892 RepID=UPI000C3421E1|nr:alpha-1,2-fucosyltransferase [Roseovarius salinarum]